MQTTQILFLLTTFAIAVGALVRGMLLGAEGRTTEGIALALTGSFTIALDATCAVTWGILN